MNLPVWATTVTPFSKKLALFMYIFLPFAGFYLGIQYGKMMIQPKSPADIVIPTISITPTPTIASFPTIHPTSSPTCTPRPACLDATPRCMIAETEDMCPPKSNQVACTMDAKLCPDGSYVSRTGPNCEFTACPK